MTVYRGRSYGDDGTKDEVDGYLDAITTLYARAATAGQGILNLIA